MTPEMTLNNSKKFKSLEETLEELSVRSKHESMSLEEICKLLSGKGKILLLLFLCIPFGQILILAMPFGFIIGFIGLCLAVDSHKVRLPNFILKKEINAKILEKVVNKVLRPIKKIKKFSYPRYNRVLGHPAVKFANGLLIAVLGVLLAIALPIPGLSFVASAALFLIGVGMLNEDGISLGIAYILGVFYSVFVIVTLNYFSVIDAIQWIYSSF